MNNFAALVVGLGLVGACGSAQQSTPASEPRPLPPMTGATPAPVLAKLQRVYMMPLRKCAHAVMKKTPSAAGVYQIEFEVQVDGSVTALGINGSSKALRTCMEKQVNAWTFAPIADKQDKPVARTLSLPVKFKPPAKSTRKADVRMISLINKRYMAGVHECHTTALARDPNAVGKVNLRYTVNVDGSITMATVIGIKNAELLSCIKRKMLTWRLPAPKDGEGKATTKTATLTVVLRAN